MYSLLMFVCLNFMARTDRRDPTGFLVHSSAQTSPLFVFEFLPTMNLFVVVLHKTYYKITVNNKHADFSVGAQFCSHKISS